MQGGNKVMNTYIIAEAGVNHNGSLETAKLMVDKAKEAGADCIKFQTFLSKNIVSKSAGKAEYQKQHTNSSESQLDMLKKLELSFEDFKELKKYCDLKEIEFLSTAFDFDSIDFLNTLGISKWKVPSGEITNLPYLVRIAKTNKPVILSTGMSTIDEIREAVDMLKANGCGNITLLHCTTEYPAPFIEVNLRAMDILKKEFKVPVGYSDHTKGIGIAIAATAMGAVVIEKHFTLDRNMEGPDHKASLEPEELKNMINSIRNIEKAMGTGEKVPSSSEIKNMNIARKSIVANCNIKQGEILSEKNITVKRPGNGISPMKWFDVLGKTAIRDFEEDELIEI
jgi:N,N'-diacetyllegionaminate synthase